MTMFTPKVVVRTVLMGLSFTLGLSGTLGIMVSVGLFTQTLSAPVQAEQTQTDDSGLALLAIEMAEELETDPFAVTTPVESVYTKEAGLLIDPPTSQDTQAHPAKVSVPGDF